MAPRRDVHKSLEWLASRVGDGLTLTDLVVVMMILGVLAAIVAISVSAFA